MTDLADRLVIKDGNVFAVIPRDGAWSGADGVWMDDCRHVSRHELRIDGAPPRVVARRRRRRPHDRPSLRGRRAAGAARARRRHDGRARSWRPGAIELEAEGDFVTIFGLRGIVAREPRAGHRTELRRHAAPGELRVEYRFSPLPRRRRPRPSWRRASSATTSASPPSCGARSRHADAGLVAGRRAVLRGGRAVVRDAVRPRQPHRRAAAHGLRAGRRGRDAAPARRADRPAWTTPSARRSRARSCTSCARARRARRWRATTAASTRRRCFCSRSRRRRRGAAGRAAAGGRGGAGVDRAPRPAHVHRRARCATRAGRTPRTACRPRSRGADRAAGLRRARRGAVLAARSRLLRDGARQRGAGLQPGPRAVGAGPITAGPRRGRSATRSWVPRCSRAGGSARSPRTSRSTTR